MTKKRPDLRRDDNDPWSLAPTQQAFLMDLVTVCQRHGYSLGHEDTHGGFQVEKYDESFSKWLYPDIREYSCFVEFAVKLLFSF